VEGRGESGLAAGGGKGKKRVRRCKKLKEGTSIKESLKQVTFESVLVAP